MLTPEMKIMSLKMSMVWYLFSSSANERSARVINGRRMVQFRFKIRNVSLFTIMFWSILEERFIFPCAQNIYECEFAQALFW